MSHKAHRNLTGNFGLHQRNLSLVESVSRSVNLVSQFSPPSELMPLHWGYQFYLRGVMVSFNLAKLTEHVAQCWKLIKLEQDINP